MVTQVLVNHGWYRRHELQLQQASGQLSSLISCLGVVSWLYCPTCGASREFSDGDMPRFEHVVALSESSGWVGLLRPRPPSSSHGVSTGASRLHMHTVDEACRHECS